MTLFQFRWLRKFVRRHTNPMDFDKAGFWKEKLSVGYMLLAWNAFGLVCYAMYKGKADWAHYHGVKSDEEVQMRPAQQFAKALNIPHAKVYSFKGFTKTGEYEIDNREAAAAAAESKFKR